MRIKTDAQQRLTMPTPPLSLRLWDDPSWQQRGQGLGCEVYATPAEWITARREWEQQHQVTITEWFSLVCEDALERGGLDGMNRVFMELLVDGEDDYEDPRESA